MTITEANHTTRILRFAAGDHAGTPDQIRESFDYLAARASNALQLRFTIDPHHVDAAITDRTGEA